MGFDARKLARVVLVSVAALSWSEMGRCQQQTIAEGLFREGRQAMRKGDYAAACPSLAESQRLDPSPGTLLNLAICEEQLGHLATAWAKYREVADTTPSG